MSAPPPFSQSRPAWSSSSSSADLRTDPAPTVLMLRMGNANKTPISILYPHRTRKDGEQHNQTLTVQLLGLGYGDHARQARLRPLLLVVLGTQLARLDALLPAVILELGNLGAPQVRLGHHEVQAARLPDFARRLSSASTNASRAWAAVACAVPNELVLQSPNKCASNYPNIERNEHNVVFIPSDSYNMVQKRRKH